MRGLVLACAIVALGSLPLPAMGQAPDTTPDSANGRYALSKTDDGFLRLDTMTGLVSVCRRKPTNWVCESLADERAVMEAAIAAREERNAALDERVAELERENAELRQAVAKLEQEAARPDANAARPKADEAERKDEARKWQFPLPGREEMDKVMTFMEDAMRRFRDMIRSLERDDNASNGQKVFTDQKVTDFTGQQITDYAR